MTNEFEIISSRMVATEALSAFLQVEYPLGDVSSEDYLQWEYAKNPFGPAYVSLAMTTGNTIASQYALLPFTIIAGGKEMKASLSLNTLTAERYRGKGLFLKTAAASYHACAEDGVTCTFGIPNANSYPGFTGRLGFRNCGNLVFSLKPLRPMKIVKSLVGGSKNKKGSDIPVDLRLSFGDESIISRFDPVQDEKLFAEFFIRWKKDSTVLIHRSSSYLQWRYMMHPTRQYYLLKYVIRGKMLAWAALRMLSVYGMKACVLMDFYCIETDAGKKLLNFISVSVKENGLDAIIAATASHAGIYPVLRASGFYNVPDFLLPQKLPFILKMHGRMDHTISLTELNNWHFMFGDYDVF